MAIWGRVISRPLGLSLSKPCPFRRGLKKERRFDKLGANGIWQETMDPDLRLKRLRYRAWHRGTREADLMIGGFFDAHHAGWTPAGFDWFEALIEEQDVDIMGWAIGSIPCPPRWDGEMMAAMRAINYVQLPR